MRSDSLGSSSLKTFILSSFLLFMALAGGLVAAQERESGSPDVESLMTPEDFEASGLDKLSDAERAHLSEWVARYRAGAVKGPEVQKPPSQWTEEEKRAEKQFRIVANVVPRFRGWYGKTVFRLDNGQTWQQRMASQKFRYNGGSSEVVISKNMLGRYVLEHVETGRSALVKRVD